ncbi:MAG TPA: hypothetical protein VIL55_06795 [Naasia sp.]|jgi:hypothetical protein
MTYRRIVKLAMASAVATGLACAWTGVSSASADTSNSVLVSLDGQQWSQSLQGLFPEEGFFPGAAYTRTIQVKNDSPVDATLEVAALDASGSTPEFLDMLVVGSRSVSGAVTELPLSAAGICTNVVQDEFVPAGATVPVDLTLRMADVSGDAGKGETAEFDVAISLRQVGMPSLAADCGAPGDSSPDPDVATTPGSGSGGASNNGSKAGAKAPFMVGDASSTSGSATEVVGTASNPPAGSAGTESQLDTLGLHDVPAGLAPALLAAAAAGIAGLTVLIVALRRRRTPKDAE